MSARLIEIVRIVNLWFPFLLWSFIEFFHHCRNGLIVFFFDCQIIKLFPLKKVRVEKCKIHFYCQLTCNLLDTVSDIRSRIRHNIPILKMMMRFKSKEKILLSPSHHLISDRLAVLLSLRNGKIDGQQSHLSTVFVATH